ncbi:MAG: DEAD/DEAH box helicase, partial [Planctomycetes bacterium]|nr:DEAD/DEAH box helicase [Planctomycetota bacterium]
MFDRVLSIPALARVSTAIERGDPPPSLGGVWGSGSALILAALHSYLRRPLLALVPGEAEETTEDLRTYGTACEMLPETEGENRHLASERLRLATAFRGGRVPVLVVSARSAGQPLPAAGEPLRVDRGGRVEMEALAARLVEHRYEHVHAVESPGEFARRGGILDVFPLGAERPVRLDLFGHTVESIREFSVSDQRTEREVAEILIPLLGDRSAELADFLPAGCWAAVREPGEALLPPLAVPTLEVRSLPAPGENVRMLSLQRFSGVLSDLASELARIPGDVRIHCANEGEEQRLRELLRDVKREVTIARGRLNRGFSFEELGASWIPHHELFNRHRLRRSLMKRPDARPIDSMLDLEKGDIVVHLYHGIGRFVGMEKSDGREFMVLEYADAARVFVPVADLDLVQKYVGVSESAPPLHILGGTAWAAAKERAQQAVEELAKDLIRVQAVREMELGNAFPADAEWQRAFELAFPYEETEDQTDIARAIKLDLQSPRPMDRLVCGDVGYGKTELAMRAAFKVATTGKQVAVLVPTTVLAEQHYRTFGERMRDYPLRIASLSRFKTAREQKTVLADLAAGTLDVVIGTHRLIQPDVKFRDLGLVVIDEEQRFGVEHKEHLKKLRATVDVLTLTATPIPRTLHMSLLGIRDVSMLQTPPAERRAVRTEVMLEDDRAIRNAILYELDRGGQVYFVHNRVHNIEKIR